MKSVRHYSKMMLIFCWLFLLTMPSLASSRSPVKCKGRADVGFLIDSSGSISRSQYRLEKRFVKSVAAAFGVSRDDSRSGVITFSNDAQLCIKLNDHTSLASFNDAVDVIPYFGGRTMIDRALRLAQRKLFTTNNGGRAGVPKLLILLTDGSQTKRRNYEDPAAIADELRNSGITLIVVGVGADIKHDELTNIAGGKDKVFGAATFDELTSDGFVKSVQDMACDASEVEPPPSCKVKADVGFLLDSSGSILEHYPKEKDFVKSVAASFGISKDGSQAGVITFSRNAEISIKLNDHTTLRSFDKAVDAIPLMAKSTRIDKALLLALKRFFRKENGGRTGVQKIVILLTDGKQSRDPGSRDPAKIAAILRKFGVNLLVVGMGSAIDKEELRRIAGGRDKVFSATTFRELLTDSFMKTVKDKACSASARTTFQICEWSKPDSRTLTCPKDSVINIVSAIYGRKSLSICKHGDHKGRTNCGTSASFTKAKQICNGQKSCSLRASNSMFGDPCWGINKYLDVTYECQPGSSTNIPREQIIKENELVTTLTTLTKNFKISFDFFATPMSGWGTVLHLMVGDRFYKEYRTTGSSVYNSRGIYDRIPLILYHASSSRLRVYCNIDGTYKRKDMSLSVNTWHSVEISQRREGESFRFSVLVDGRKQWDELNSNAQIFYKVKVYTGNNVNTGIPVQNGRLRNLIIENIEPPIQCKGRADVGFILDSSSSIKDKDYQKEKDFLKAVAAAFGVSKDDSRAGVITFSRRAVLSIKLNDHTTVTSFNKAVDAIPYMGSLTRIDKSLRLAQSQLFTNSNGGRAGVPKLLILLTDGSQTKRGAEDPASIADELRNSGIALIAIGMGSMVNNDELTSIAGGKDNVFGAATFDELTSNKFVKSVQDKACDASNVPTCNVKVDVGFLLDSSGSIEHHYQEEKDFVKSVAASFGVSKDESRAGVITFSGGAVISIKLNDHTTLTSFNRAVDAIPFMKQNTRIDLALLRVKKFFTTGNGGRPGVQQIVILLTDGKQSKSSSNPAVIARRLRNSGVTLLVVGMGVRVDKDELENIAGSKDKVFSATSFNELLSDSFLKTVREKACPGA